MSFAKNCLLYAMIIAFVGCANIQAPSGGLGDKTPPAIVAQFPDNNTTQFDGNSIEIEFSKYMNRASVIENMTLAPTCVYKYEWKGKKIIINFSAPLASNTTYSLQISGDCSDYKGNKISSPFSFVFSTGEMIDTGKIIGRIFPEGKNYFIFCYSVAEEEVINTQYILKTPEYRVRVAENSTFVVPALKNGKYLVIGVMDKDKDGIINTTTDTLAFPTHFSIIENGSNALTNIVVSSTIQVTQDTANTTPADTTKDTLTQTVDTNPTMYFRGEIKNNTLFDKIILATQNITYLSEIKNNTFSFDSIKSGEYQIILFHDSDADGKFCKGSITPFTLAEPFYYVPLKVKIKERWNVDNYIINIP